MNFEVRDTLCFYDFVINNTYTREADIFKFWTAGHQLFFICFKVVICVAVYLIKSSKIKMLDDTVVF
jgi:hypothetical protein